MKKNMGFSLTIDQAWGKGGGGSCPWVHLWLSLEFFGKSCKKSETLISLSITSQQFSQVVW